MATPISSLPAVGVDARSISDQKIYNALQELQQLLSQSTTGLTGDNLSLALARILGVSDSSVTRRGKSIIATTETRTNVAYGLMPTPDRVQNIVLPTDGLIFVAYQASWQESVLSTAVASIFVGANQLTGASGGSASPTAEFASLGGSNVAKYAPLATFPGGLTSASPSGTDQGADVSTGQMVGLIGSSFGGGVTTIFAAAGTYDISVQFKSTSGSVTAKNRKLWVWTQSFG